MNIFLKTIPLLVLILLPISSQGMDFSQISNLYVIESVDDKKVLCQQGQWSKESGKKLEVYKQLFRADQIWFIIPKESTGNQKTFEIRNLFSGKSLSISGKWPKDKSRDLTKDSSLNVWTNNDDPDQRWNLISRNKNNTNFEIKSDYDNFSLTVSDSQVRLDKFQNANNQLWRITLYSSINELMPDDILQKSTIALTKGRFNDNTFTIPKGHENKDLNDVSIKEDISTFIRFHAQDRLRDIIIKLDFYKEGEVSGAKNRCWLRSALYYTFFKVFNQKDLPEEIFWERFHFAFIEGIKKKNLWENEVVAMDNFTRYRALAPISITEITLNPEYEKIFDTVAMGIFNDDSALSHQAITAINGNLMGTNEMAEKICAYFGLTLVYLSTDNNGILLENTQEVGLINEVFMFYPYVVFHLGNHFNILIPKN